MPRLRQISDEQIIREARRCFLKYGTGISTTVIVMLIFASVQAFAQEEKSPKNILVSQNPNDASTVVTSPLEDEEPFLREGQISVIVQNILLYSNASFLQTSRVGQ